MQRSPGAEDDMDDGDGASVASCLRDVLSGAAGGAAVRDGDDTESVMSGTLSDDALAYGGSRSATAPLLPDG